MFTTKKFRTLSVAVLLGILGVAPIISVTYASPVKNAETSRKIILPGPLTEGCSEWKWWLCWGNEPEKGARLSVYTLKNLPPKALSPEQLKQLKPAAKNFTEQLQNLLEGLERRNITRTEYNLINTKIINLVQSNRDVLIDARQWPNQQTADKFKLLANEIGTDKSPMKKINWKQFGYNIGQFFQGLFEGLVA